MFYTLLEINTLLSRNLVLMNDQRILEESKISREPIYIKLSGS
jgi:hypothetical protein